MKRIFTFLLLLFYMYSSNASQNIVINNAMHSDLMIEDVNTKGSIVLDSLRLIDMTLKSKQKTTLHIDIVSPVCRQQQNFAVLNIKGHNVFIRWGKEGVNLENDQYVVDGSYRITQELDAAGNIVFSFYDDDIDSRTALLNAAKTRLKLIATQQQKPSKTDIIRYSGITEQELQNE